jgi:hypothetical protein
MILEDIKVIAMLMFAFNDLIILRSGSSGPAPFSP